jgi:hypothetical protein
MNVKPAATKKKTSGLGGENDYEDYYETLNYYDDTAGRDRATSSLLLPVRFYATLCFKGKEPKPPPLVLPPPPLPNPLHHIHEPQQHRHLDQRPHRRRKRLVAVRAIGRDGDGDGELEVVARGGEALGGGELVAEAEAAAEQQGGEEDDGEVDDERRGDAHHGHDLVHDLLALRGEEHEDREEQADERPGPGPLEEDGVVPGGAGEPAEREAREDRGGEGDAEEDGDGLGDDGVGDAGGVAAADDRDEEDGEGCEEHHLEDRVNGHEDGAVLAVAAGEAGPDEDHGDAAGDADEDQAFAEAGLVWEECPGEGEL